MPIRLWQEQCSLEEAFSRLNGFGLAHAALADASRKLLYLRNFDVYAIHPPTSARLAQLWQQFCESVPSENHAQFFRKTHQTSDTFRAQLAFEEQLFALKNAIVPSDAVQTAFVQKKAGLDRVVFAILRVEREALAWELCHRIRDEHQAFGPLAMRYSKGPEARQEGVVGPTPPNRLNPELLHRLEALADGACSDPFSLDGTSYNLIQRIRIERAQLTPALEKTLREELFEAWTQRQLEQMDLHWVSPTGALAGASV